MRPDVQTVLRLLKDKGPMSTDQLAQLFPDHPMRNVSRVISDIRSSVQFRRIYIIRWRMTSRRTKKNYPRAVYAVGSEADAPKPPRKSGAEITDRYRKRKRMLAAKEQLELLDKLAVIEQSKKHIPNSIFALGANLETHRPTHASPASDDRADVALLGG